MTKENLSLKWTEKDRSEAIIEPLTKHIFRSMNLSYLNVNDKFEVIGWARRDKKIKPTKCENEVQWNFLKQSRDLIEFATRPHWANATVQKLLILLQDRFNKVTLPKFQTVSFDWHLAQATWNCHHINVTNFSLNLKKEKVETSQTSLTAANVTHWSPILAFVFQ